MISQQQGNVKSKVLLSIGFIWAFLTILAEGYRCSGYGMLISIIFLCIYIYALIRRNLELIKSAYFMWMVSVIFRVAAYVFYYGYLSYGILRTVDLIITMLLLWLGVRGLMVSQQPVHSQSISN